jgi:hypothetical protein
MSFIVDPKNPNKKYDINSVTGKKLLTARKKAEAAAKKKAKAASDSSEA